MNKNNELVLLDAWFVVEYLWLNGHPQFFIQEYGETYFRLNWVRMEMVTREHLENVSSANGPLKTKKVQYWSEIRRSYRKKIVLQ